jgi:GT2 family glycosyltransferase
VVIASAGRPELLGRTIQFITALDYPDFRVVVTVPTDESVPANFGEWGVEIVTGAIGLTSQRNAAVKHLGEAVEFVFFFDDDAIPDAHYLDRGVAAFTASSEVVGITGRVVADGAAIDVEISIEDAQRLLAETADTTDTGLSAPCKTLYGCNFAVRRTIFEQEMFDSRLPLYGWLEDYDFSQRTLRHGALITSNDARVVHLGAKSGGRTSNVRLGYSQIVNPFYLWRKGTMPILTALRHIGRPGAKNVVLSIGGQDKRRRRERLKGNMMGISDIIRRRSDPEHAAQIK